MKRFFKLISISLMLVLSFTMLFGCTTAGPDPNGENPSGITVLRFWNGFTGADGEAMDKIVEQFNKAYEEENIRVVADKIPWDTLFTKLTTTSSNLRSAPHIVAMNAERMAGMDARGIFLPMDGIEEYLGVSGSEYITSAWNAGVLNGRRVGFPLDVHPTAMFYNKNLISEDELPTTWEEFRDVCIEKTTGSVYGFAVPSMYSITKDIFLSMLYEAGGSVFDSDNQPVYDSEIAIRQLTFLSDLVNGENPVSPKNVGAGGDYTLFTQGKSVFYFDGPWLITTFGLYENPNSNIGVAPMPNSEGNGVTYAGSHQFTLMKNTVTDEKTKEACYTFMRYVNEHSIDWAKAGQVPALKSLHETEEYKALKPLQPFTQLAYGAVLGETSYQYYYEGYNHVGEAVSNAIKGGDYTPTRALQTSVADLKAWIADQAY